MSDSHTDTERSVTASHPRATREKSMGSRRQFLRQAGGIAGVGALLLSACDSDSNGDTGGGMDQEVVLDFSSDFGVLNYALALEQLEAAFYAEAAANFYGDPSSVEGQYFQDLAAHEAIHRDFLAAAIPALGGQAIPGLEVDFSSIDFSNRDQVLATAQVLEDTGVSAYNGAGIFLSDMNLLTIAGKIVSVEARHAASIRALINPGSASFAGDDIVDPNTGLDVAAPPDEVLSAVADTGFVVTPIRLQNVNA